ncbi:MAG: WXG100 family type VII secretion target [bacterium]|nr:WXG100 family type VII secretion target [bacterium]
MNFAARYSAMDGGSQGLVQLRLAQMREAAASIEASARRVSDAISAADSEIRPLTGGALASSAADAFFADYHRLTPELREAYAHLMRFQDKLVKAADEIELAARAVE